MFGNIDCGEIFTNILDIDSDDSPSCNCVEGESIGMRQIEIQSAIILIVRDSRLTVFVIGESQFGWRKPEISGKDCPQHPASSNILITIYGAMEPHGPSVFILRK
jgi:hypothetical protein